MSCSVTVAQVPLVPVEINILQSRQNSCCLLVGKCGIVLCRAECFSFLHFFSGERENINLPVSSALEHYRRRTTVPLQNNIVACVSLSTVPFLAGLRQAESGLSAE